MSSISPVFKSDAFFSVPFVQKMIVVMFAVGITIYVCLRGRKQKNSLVQEKWENHKVELDYLEKKDWDLIV